jgi:spore maturation protein CgeB
MRTLPTIAMFGSSLVSAYWNGAATYYRGIIRNLHARGFHVTFYEPDAYERQRHRDLDDPEWARVVVYDATPDGACAALEDASSADVLIKASGVGVFDEFLEAEIPRLGATLGKTTVFWDVDAPATLQRMRENSADPFRTQVARYDLILTYGGGPAVVEQYRKRGARSCVPIYNALDPQTHFPVAPDSRFSGDLAFLGNRLPDREERVKAFFFAPARALRDMRFVLGGSGWDRNVELSPNMSYVGHVYTREHNAFNCSALAVININRNSMAATGYSPPTRVFEAAGAGACLICDAWRGLEQFLDPEEEVICVESGAEVAALLPALEPNVASRIGQAARRRVLAHHTYAHRAAQVDSLLAGTPSSGTMRARPEERFRAAFD